jgi:hypothetical protein
MKIIYRVSEEDYVGARDLFVANEKPFYRRVSRRAMPWTGGLLLILAILFAVGPQRNLNLALVNVAIGTYLLYCGFAIHRYFRRAYRKDQRFQYDFTLDASEEGIHVVTPTSESEMKWATFVRYLESDKIFMLFIADLLFIVVPKRAFASGEVDQFRDLLRRNLAA